MTAQSMEAQVELQSVSRRIGVKPKALKQVLKQHNVSALSVQPDGSSIYSWEATLAVLSGLTAADKSFLESNLLPPEKRFQGALEGKFTALADYQFTEAITIDNPQDRGISEYEYSTMLNTPVDEKYIAAALNISVRRAKEFMVTTNLPTYPHASQKKKVWELADVQYKLSNLSKNEKLSIQLWSKQFSGGAHMHDAAIAKLLNVNVELIPALKHHYKLDHSYPLTKSMIIAVAADSDYADVVNGLKERQTTSFASSDSRYISQAEIAEKNHITLTEVRRLLDSKVIPREPNGRILRKSAEQLGKAILSKSISKSNHLNYIQIGELLNITSEAARKLLEKNKLKPINGYRNMQGMWVPTFLKADVLKLKGTPAHKQAEGAYQLSREEMEAKSATISEIRQKLFDNITVNVRERNEHPESTTIYVGPTNSGKTYTSLNNLFKEYEHNPTGKYVYAGPLRMLAYEVYLKMVDLYGEENCGFLTGEESINPEAPLIACTVEMAPTEGDSLVLDETHWIVEPSRGQNWTNLLIGSRYKQFHVLTAAEAVKTVKELMSDSQNITVNNYQRKTPLVYKGFLPVKEVPSKTAVVCFSRKSVYAIAYELEKTGKKVGVLYGALPLPVRKAQIQKYIDGEYDIMVTTDVIGHGINLPIDNVVFAQTEKFDGREQRSLYIWEAAQIAGRAGRYGLSAEGHVYLLEGLDWLSKDQQIVKDGTAAGAGLIPTDLNVEKGVLSPRLADLNITKQSEILVALEAWETKANAILADRPITPSGMEDKKQLLRFMSNHLEAALYPWAEKQNWSISTEIVWQLISGPFDANGESFPEIIDWLAKREPEGSAALQDYLWQLNQLIDITSDNEVDRSGSTEDIVDVLEKAVHSIGELKMTYLMFNHAGKLSYAEILETEDRFNEAIITALHKTITQGIYGKCENCGEPSSPWFRYCEPCFNSLHSYWDNY